MSPVACTPRLKSRRANILNRGRNSRSRGPFGTVRSRRLTLEPLEQRTLLSATVATDQQDYAPGDVAQICGRGFAVGETVELQVLHTDATPNTGDGHTPWQVTDGSPDDLDGQLDGNIQTTWYVNPDDSLGSTFQLTARGLTSQETATTTFTDDSTKVGSVLVGAQVGTLTSGTAGSATFPITVNRGSGGGSSGAFYATLSIANLPAGAAGSFSPTSVHFDSSDNSKTATLTVSIDSTTPAGSTVFTVTATRNEAPGDYKSGTGTLVVGGGLPSVSLSVSPTSVLEDGPANLVYTFTRTGSTANSLTVNFTLGGTATLSTDYTQTGATLSGSSGTVTFAAGGSTALVTVDPTPDTTVEPDETVALTLTAETGYTVGTPGSATGTILNDDTSVTVAVSPASVAEDGATNLVYTFTRAGVTTGALTVYFGVAGSATYSTDYTESGAATFSGTAGTVTFAAGHSTATVTVDPTPDTTVEPDETVALTLTAETGYTVGSPGSATGTILNDDSVLIVGADAGKNTQPYVAVIDNATSTVLVKFLAYEKTFRGGVRVAFADLTGDGVPEIITAPGRGRAPQVRVFTQTGEELTRFRTMAYGAKFTNGVQVAVGDVNHDGKPDLVTVPSAGSAEVRVFKNQFGVPGHDLDPIQQTAICTFPAFPAKFVGGGVVAVADMGTFSNGTCLDPAHPDGWGEILVGSGAGMRATVYVFDVSPAFQPVAKKPVVVRTFLPFASTFRGGVASLSMARVNGDLIPDVLVGAGNGGGSAVEIWDGQSPNTRLLRFAPPAYTDASRNAPVRVVFKDLDHDGIVDRIFAGQGSDGKTRQIRAFTMNGTPTPVDYIMENGLGLFSGFFGAYFLA